MVYPADKRSAEYYAANVLISRTNLEDFDPALHHDVHALRERFIKWIDALQATKRTQLPEVFKKIENRLSVRSLTAFYGALEKASNPQQNFLIAKCIYEDAGIAMIDGGADDALYVEMLGFLGVPEMTRRKSRAALEGTYQLWRHSTSIPGQYLKAIVEIGGSDKANAVRVRVLQRYTPKGSNADHLGAPGDQIDEGYIFRRSGEKHYILILSDEAEKTSSNRGGLRLALFRPTSHVYPERIKVFTLEGMVLGLDEATMIFSGVYMERVSDNYPGIDKYISTLALKEKETGVPIGPNIYEEKDVPGKVLAILKQHPPFRE